MRIRTAIFGVYVAASALGFAVLMTFVLKEVRPRYVESMRRALADTATLLAALIEEDAQKRGGAGLAESWRENLGALERASGALRVYVTDRRGVVAFDSAGGRDVGADYTRRPEVAAYFNSRYGVEDSVDLVAGELRVTAPVRNAKGETVGLVGVARPLSSVTEAILRARLRLVFGSLAVAALMTAAGWWIAAKLTRSLERLTAYAVAARENRAGRPPQSRAREVAALAKAFEEMRVALEGKEYVERYTQALAHEVKAPLSAIRGAAELLQEDLPGEERALFLANLRGESERLQRIVDRMLRLAALEARRGLEETERVSMAGVAREAVEALRAVWTARAVEVSIEVSATDTIRDEACVRRGAITTTEADAVTVNGEAFLLVQAVVNLVQNAVEFSAPGQVVRVRVERVAGDAGSAGKREVCGVLERESGRVRVVVEDSGPGVPDFAKERIFERFYSLPRPADGRRSTGLGLSFVREIAALHGGSAEVGNRPEGGTRAVLSLPAG